jgi:hypothetical protein
VGREERPSEKGRRKEEVMVEACFCPGKRQCDPVAKSRRPSEVWMGSAAEFHGLNNMPATTTKEWTNFIIHLRGFPISCRRVPEHQAP